MTPLFACFPVCLLFVTLGILGLLVVVLGLSNPVPGDDKQTATTDGPPSSGATGPPPWWVLPLIIVVLTAVMLVLAWYFPG